MLKHLLMLAICLTPAFNFADDPAPAPAETQSIQAVSTVKGTGKKDAPYQFDETTICVLSLPASVTDENLKDVNWDFEMSPDGIVAIQNKRLIVFPINQSGVFKAAAYGKAGYWTVWFEIKGPNAPPPPVGSDVQARAKKMMVGPTAKQDAAVLIGTCQATIAMIDKFKTFGELQKKFVENLNASGWHTGSYPDFGKMLNENIPPDNPTGDPRTIEAADRQRLTKFFSDIEAGVKETLQ